MLDLILKDIPDLYTRDNFFKIKNFISDQALLDAGFKLFDVTIAAKDSNFRVQHGLSFIPLDIIPLSIFGNYNFYFKYNNFDNDSLYINAQGPVRIRFLAGKLKNLSKGSNQAQSPSTIAPGPRVGIAVLVGGSVTVSNTSITSGSQIFVTAQINGGTPGFLRITAKTIGTSFVITSSSGTDTSTVAWQILEQNT